MWRSVLSCCWINGNQSVVYGSEDCRRIFPVCCPTWCLPRRHWCDEWWYLLWETAKWFYFHHRAKIWGSEDDAFWSRMNTNGRTSTLVEGKRVLGDSINLPVAQFVHTSGVLEYGVEYYNAWSTICTCRCHQSLHYWYEYSKLWMLALHTIAKHTYAWDLPTSKRALRRPKKDDERYPWWDNFSTNLFSMAVIFACVLECMQFQMHAFACTCMHIFQ